MNAGTNQQAPNKNGSISGSRPGGFYPQVHALRAIAVSMVLLYHLWPNRYQGGFIGVDVFLVISGFLITGHIWRQRAEGWRMLPKFWARRVLRLGPAALTVVTVSGALVLAFVPQVFWERYAREAIASVLISVNFVLFGDSVDYLAADNAPTPFQHYWSLSVEEQFYLVWPLIIIAAALFAKRVLAARSAELVGVTVIAAVSVASFAWSLVVLPSNPSAAYFMMPLRIWEFGFGAILALLMPAIVAAKRPAWLRLGARVLLPLAYLALIVNGYVLTGATPFPGWAALLPVVLTVCIILVHPCAELDQVRPWTALEQGPIVRFLGDVSYSAYLWHWPLIILTPFILGRELSFPVKLGILALTFFLAWVTTRWIETPLRSLPGWNWKLARKRLMIIVAWALCAVLAWGAALWIGARYERVQFSAEQTAEQCFGARMALAPEICGALPGELPPSDVLASAAADMPDPWIQDCDSTIHQAEGPHCEYLYSADPDAPAILLWGDSHAGAWSPAFEEAAKNLGFNLYTYMRDGCPPVAVSPIATVMGRDISEEEQQNCANRNLEVRDFVQSHPNIVGVFAANLSSNYIYAEGADFGEIDTVLAEIQAEGRVVALMGDVPLTGDAYGDRLNVAECLAQNSADPSVCNNSRERALNSMAQREFVRAKLGQDFPVLESQENFCDATTCYAAVGGVPVFFDASHLTDTFSRSLGMWLTEQIGPLLDAQ